MDPAAGRAQARVHRLLIIENRLTTMPLAWLTLAALLATIVKSGVTIRPFDADPLESFPIPRDTWAQLSYGMRISHWIVGSESLTVPTLVSFGLISVAAVVVASEANRLPSQLSGRIVLVVLLMGPVFTVLLSNVGRPDSFTLLGALVLGLKGRRIPWAITGALLMVLGNPEQTVMATTILLGLTAIPSLRAWRPGAVTALAIGLSSYLLLAAYARSAGVGSRLDYVLDLIGNSVYGFTANLSLSLYAGYAVLWLVLLVFALKLSRSQLTVLLVFAILLPVGITAVTLDQTRVFVGVSTAGIAAITVIAVGEFEGLSSRWGLKFPLLLVTAIALFLPAFEVSDQHTVRPPLSWMYSTAVERLSGGG